MPRSGGSILHGQGDKAQRTATLPERKKHPFGQGCREILREKNKNLVGKNRVPELKPNTVPSLLTPVDNPSLEPLWLGSCRLGLIPVPDCPLTTCRERVAGTGNGPSSLVKRQQKPPRQQPQLQFWNSVSAQISQQLWLLSSSCHAEEWGSGPVAHGWANCRRWSSGPEVKEPFTSVKLFTSVPDDMGEESPTNKAKTEKEPTAKAKRYRLYPTAEETPYDIWDAAMDDLLKSVASGAASTRTMRSRFRSRTALDKSASRRASSSTASTGCGAVGSAPFFGT
ncbi:hypothetical protein V1504DRAFT_478260 [Lipomyces starkeyi]